MSDSVLIFHSGPLAGKGTKIKKNPSTIGRSSTCDITVLDPSISREHARVICENDRWFIKDLGSNNGLRVNGKKTEEIELKNGTKFLLGKLEVEFINAALPVAMQEMEASGENSDFIDTPPSGTPMSDAEASDNYDLKESAELERLKQKRIQNILILFFVVIGLGLLGYFAVKVLNQKDRPLHKTYVRMNTNSEFIVDLYFIPLTNNEALLKPFNVYDYNIIEMKSDVLRLEEDLQIDEKTLDPNRTIKLKSSYKSGSCEIHFYKVVKEERTLIGLLSLDIERRVIPEEIRENMDSDLQTKTNIAKFILVETEKIKNDISQKETVLKNLRMAKQLFENGGAKPEIYHTIEKEYYDLIKETERTTGSYWSTFEVNARVRKWEECLNALNNIIMLNPDTESFHNQKARILHRRVRYQLL